MKPISGLLTGGVLPALLLVAACSATGQPSPPQTVAGTGTNHDRAGVDPRRTGTTDHSAGPGAPTGGAAHHRSGGASGRLSAALVSAADLSPGYRPGTHHSAPAGRPPRVSPACAPIGQILRAHPNEQHQRPQVRVLFSKSHFGPQLSQTIIDYGHPAAATQAVRRVARASRDCDRYVHSTSPVGANTYTVRPTPDAHSNHPSHHGTGSIALRLSAAGKQFAGLHWDVWVTSAGSRVAAVAFRSVPGGDNDDWHTAIPAAQHALDGAAATPRDGAPKSAPRHTHP